MGGQNLTAVELKGCTYVQAVLIIRTYSYYFILEVLRSITGIFSGVRRLSVSITWYWYVLFW